MTCTYILASCVSAPKVINVTMLKGTVVDHDTAFPLDNVLVAVLLDMDTFVFGTYSKKRWDEYYTFTQANGEFELQPLKRLGCVSRTYMGKASAPTPQIAAFKAGYKLKKFTLNSNGEDIHITLRRLAEGKKYPHDEAIRLINRLMAYGDGKAGSDEDEQSLRQVQTTLDSK